MVKLIPKQLCMTERTRAEKFIANNTILLFVISVLFVICSGATLLALTLSRSNIEHDNTRRFWLNQFAKYVIIALIQFITGLAVIKLSIKVNYTRKIIHMFYFLVPLILDKFILHFESDVYSTLWNIWLILFLLMFMSEIFVKRFRIFEIMYAAIDRPEDVHTTLWFASQIIVSAAVIFGFSYVFINIFERSNWVFIGIIIVALGDGLAEPVGVRFGKHKYTTKALCTRVEYTRSIEGSMCVFIVSIIAIAAYFNEFELYEFIPAIIALPPIMTLVEAYAPHTWDNPLLLLTCYVILSIIYLCN